MSWLMSPLPPAIASRNALVETWFVSHCSLRCAEQDRDEGRDVRPGAQLGSCTEYMP